MSRTSPRRRAFTGTDPMSAFAAGMRPLVADMVHDVLTEFATQWLQQQGATIAFAAAQEPEVAVDAALVPVTPTEAPRPRQRTIGRGSLPTPMPATTQPTVTADAE